MGIWLAWPRNVQFVKHFLKEIVQPKTDNKNMIFAYWSHVHVHALQVHLQSHACVVLHDAELNIACRMHCAMPMLLQVGSVDLDFGIHTYKYMYMHTRKKETPSLFFCKFLNDQMEYTEGGLIGYSPIFKKSSWISGVSFLGVWIGSLLWKVAQILGSICF